MLIFPSIGIRSLTIAAAACGTLVFSGGPVQARSYRLADEIKLSGCLVRGEGNGGGYLLVNSPGDPGWLSKEDHKVAPSAVGTAGGPTTVFYWLGGSKDLPAHIGHLVEVEGEFQGDVRAGEMKVDRKDHWTEVTVSSNGQKMKARVPHAVLVSDNGDHKKGDILVRRVNVDHVKMLGAAC
jgi:hypothetical protein